MQRPDDRKPSPVEQSTPEDNARTSTARRRRPRGNSNPTPRSSATLSTASANKKPLQGGMLIQQGTEGMMNRGKSMAEKASMPFSSKSSPCHASSSPDLFQLDEIWEKDLSKVSLPDYVKENTTTITFPEKLMLMLIHIERVFAAAGKKDEDAPIGWTLNGRAFVIRSKEELVQSWLPTFFRQGKFQSFIRKLYRWEFRQVNLPRSSSQEERKFIFASPHFQRAKPSLMAHMRSVTAASVRREQEEKVLSEGKLPDHNIETLMPHRREGLMGMGLPSLADAIMSNPSFLSNPSRASSQQTRPLELPHMPSATIGDQIQARTLLDLDPVTRHILLGQREVRLDAEPSLADLLRQQQQEQQQQEALRRLNMASLAGFDLLGLSNIMIPPPTTRDPFQSLLESAADPLARLENFHRERTVQQRLRELAEQFLRGNNNNNNGPSSQHS
mmetsp:Transcript_276/g.573  ORF Transcript_276/g.573 Transcript_276/m.573 type:complete len:444 (+) Transcript_276:228-1559(+)